MNSKLSAGAPVITGEAVDLGFRRIFKTFFYFILSYPLANVLLMQKSKYLLN